MCHQLHLRAEAPTGGKKRYAGCPLSPRYGSLGPCQKSASRSLPGDVPAAAAREGSTAGLLPGVPPLLSPSFVYRPAVAEAEASWQQQSPATGSPPGSAAQFIPRPSLLPGPWHQPAPRQTTLSDHSRRGYRLLSPNAAPHLFPGRWRSPDPSPPRTAAPLSQAGPC